MKNFLCVVSVLVFSFTPMIAVAEATTNPLAPTNVAKTTQPTDQPLTEPPESDIEFAIEPVDPSVGNLQLEAILPKKPAPLLIDGKAYLTYELFIANVGNPTFKILRVDLVDADHPDKVLMSFAQDQLLDMIKSFQLTDPDSDQSLVMRPGVKQVLFFMPGFKNLKDVPHKIINRFVLAAPGARQVENDDDNSDNGQQGPATTTVTVPVEVDTTAPLAMAAPLRGDHWLAANGPSNTSLHRRARDTNNGTTYYPERFAIDFMQIGPNGKAYKGTADKNENYYGYGAKVYAVGTGKVIAVYDGIADNTPGSRDYPINLANVAGNFVLLDIGNKHYAFYAHLIPHSIKVRRGEIVMKGQLIGLVGNSGNSDAPHLHFHVVDRASALAAQGVPYAFVHFTTEDYKIANPESGDPTFVFGGHRTQHHGELVSENAMINFDSGDK